jgi:hypothetical protein
LMWALHFQIGLSLNYLQPRLNGFHYRFPCVGIVILYWITTQLHSTRTKVVFVGLHVQVLHHTKPF